MVISDFIACWPIIATAGIGMWLDINKKLNYPYLYFMLGQIGIFGWFFMREFLKT